MILFSRFHWRSIHEEEGWRWYYSAAYTEDRSLGRNVILFSRLHWRSIPEENDDLIQSLALKVNQKKVILFSRLHWRSIRRRWSYSAACTEGRSEKGDFIQPFALKVDQKKVILFSRLHWRSIPEENDDLIQPLTLKFNRKNVMILFSRLRWRSIPRQEGDLIQPPALKVDSLGKGMFDRLPLSGPWWNGKEWYDRRQPDIGETIMIWYVVIWSSPIWCWWNDNDMMMWYDRRQFDVGETIWCDWVDSLGEFLLGNFSGYE